MSLKVKLDQDIKQAMLAGDKTLVMTLRGLKSAILNVEVAEGSRDSGLADDKITNLFAKEAKKRQESADMYVQGGSQEKANAELEEKRVIEAYLPDQLSEEDIQKLVDEAITTTGATGPAQMGQVISMVKQKVGASADGAVIARLAMEKLS